MTYGTHVFFAVLANGQAVDPLGYMPPIRTAESRGSAPPPLPQGGGERLRYGRIAKPSAAIICWARPTLAPQVILPASPHWAQTGRHSSCGVPQASQRQCGSAGALAAGAAPRTRPPARPRRPAMPPAAARRAARPGQRPAPPRAKVRAWGRLPASSAAWARSRWLSGLVGLPAVSHSAPRLAGHEAAARQRRRGQRPGAAPWPSSPAARPARASRGRPRAGGGRRRGRRA